MPEAISVFLAPPSWEALEARLVGRGTETAEVIERRLATARTELAAQHSRPPDPPATQTHPAPAQPLALGRRMACAVAQHNRLPPPTTRLTIPPNTARPGTNKGKAGQTSRPNTSAHRTIKINAQPIQPRPPSVDPGLVSQPGGAKNSSA